MQHVLIYAGFTRAINQIPANTDQISFSAFL